MGNLFVMPNRVITGEHGLETSQEYMKDFGKKAFIVTDQMMIDLGNGEVIKKCLQQQNIKYEVFPGINGEPTDQMIEEGLRLYEESKCDFFIALGGGSPIDSMKAIATLAASGGKIADYMGKVIEKKVPPMVAIPTTAGTGSEATQFTIITDTVNQVKMLLKGSALMPNLAVVDPRFTMTAPPKITAATGLDALTHAIEAYTSRKAQPLSDIFAKSAVERIFKALPTAFKDGKNVNAREQMSIASLEAGIAFNNASVTIIHGMSRPIGALYHVAHGLSNAMLLKECFSYVLDGAYDRFAELGRIIHVAGEDVADKEAANMFLKAVVELCNTLEVPTLEEYGINRDDFFANIEKMAGDAMASGSPGNTRKEIATADVINIYKNLWS